MTFDRPTAVGKMRAVVLGAGASAAYGKSPTGLRMPLARTFFRTFAALPGAQHPWVHLHGLIAYLEEHKKVANPIDYLAQVPDIEELHSEIHERAMSTLGVHLTEECFFAFAAHHQLIFLFTFVLNAIQNGPVSALHQRLASLLEPQDGIITFNWDTLMDRALAECTSWTVDRGYGVRPFRVFRNEWQEPSTCSTGPKLWKLHGSANWITSHEQAEEGQIILIQRRKADTLHVFEWARDPYVCYRGRFTPGYQPYSYGYYPPNILDDPGRSAGAGRVLASWQLNVPGVPEGSAESHGLISMPMIVPPVKAKAYDQFGSLFTTVWQGAEDLLASADQIAILGYSFPRTDHRSIQLFTNAFMRRKTLPEVVIIDPYPSKAFDVFQHTLGIPAGRIKVEEVFLDDATDIHRLLGI